MLLMFGEANSIGFVLLEEDEVKVRYLTSTMTASKTSGKFTYAIWGRFFNEGDDSRSGYVTAHHEAVRAASELKDILSHYEVGNFRASPALPRVFISTVGQGHDQCG